MSVTDLDRHLFNEGRHFRLYDLLGAHAEPDGVRFAVWAPNARRVHVIGDRTGWQPAATTELAPTASTGIWTANLDGWQPGDRYKYRIESSAGPLEKADPVAFAAELPPATASVVADLSYAWHDRDWLANRAAHQALDRPLSIYELHLGSWRRHDDGRPLGYRELAPALIEHVHATGFTHVELLPVMEHPFYGSWGYQTTGYFAPTSRYGSPTDFMAFVDELHQAGIGVVLDWVPSHFPDDPHGLGLFDGTHLYEHADPRQGFHPDWHSLIFNYGRREVRAFLVSSARFWLERYHADAIRVDAVASMLYLDYSRRAGEWIPNREGGRENLDAVQFLRELNEELYRAFPDIQTIAEESTAWPGVSQPVFAGGLGFGMKWDMGWMHDTLQYLSRDAIHRRFHHDELTFRQIYATTENYLLPLSHDEVVHGKGSLLRKFPGDEWQQHATLRLLIAYQWALPGKKLLFMGGELAVADEWSHEQALDWNRLTTDPRAAGMYRWVGDLNRLLQRTPALHELDFDGAGFEWAVNQSEESVLAFLRYDAAGRPLLFVANFTPVPRPNLRIPVPTGGPWRELLNSDSELYGGSGVGNLGSVSTHAVPMGRHDWSLTLTAPPLAALFLAP